MNGKLDILNTLIYRKDIKFYNKYCIYEFTVSGKHLEYLRNTFNIDKNISFPLS